MSDWTDQYIAGPSRSRVSPSTPNLRADSGYVPQPTPHRHPVVQGSTPRVAHLSRVDPASPTLKELSLSLDFGDIDVRPVVQAARVSPMRTAPRSAFIPAPPNFVTPALRFQWGNSEDHRRALYHCHRSERARRPRSSGAEARTSTRRTTRTSSGTSRATGGAGTAAVARRRASASPPRSTTS